VMHLALAFAGLAGAAIHSRSKSVTMKVDDD